MDLSVRCPILSLDPTARNLFRFARKDICRWQKPFHSMGDDTRPAKATDWVYDPIGKQPRTRDGQEKRKCIFFFRGRVSGLLLLFLFFFFSSFLWNCELVFLVDPSIRRLSLQLINFNHLILGFYRNWVSGEKRRIGNRTKEKKNTFENPAPWRRYRSRSASSRKMWSRRCSSIPTRPSTTPVASFETRLPKLISDNVSPRTFYLRCLRFRPSSRDGPFLLFIF